MVLESVLSYLGVKISPVWGFPICFWVANMLCLVIWLTSSIAKDNPWEENEANPHKFKKLSGFILLWVFVCLLAHNEEGPINAS